jgi:low affinity Fe/Cu permease
MQHTQNHDDLAMQLKLDEVIRALDAASNLVMRIEDNSWHELRLLQKKYQEDPNAAPHEERRRTTISAEG